MATIEIDNSFSKLIDFDDSSTKRVMNALTYHDESITREKEALWMALKKAALKKQFKYVVMLKHKIAELGPDKICWLKDNEFPTGLINVVAKALAEEPFTIRDLRIVPKNFTLFRWNNKPEELRYYQAEAAKAFMEVHRGVFQCAVGCHAKGQGILMYDGSIKKVEEIKVNDLLMGPDSKPRTVLKLFNGKDNMYEIIPVKGQSFTVNQNHILSLQRVKKINKLGFGTKYINHGSVSFKGHNPVTNISVKDYLDKSNNFKRNNKLYRTAINFSICNVDLEIPPYQLGLWLGDGHSVTPALTTMDKEISKEWCEYAASFGMNITMQNLANNKAKIYSIVSIKRPGVSRHNIILNTFRQLNLINNKHIPHKYLISSREQRLELLAGLMDTDGSMSKNGFDFLQKNKLLANQVCYLARSLGLAAYIKECKKSCQTGAVGIYYRISISGDCSIIPVRLQRKKASKRLQKKNVLRTGFKIEAKGYDEYYGFQVDKDNLYLLDDFIVTHNSGKTRIAIELIKELGVNTLFVVPSSALLTQAHDVLESCLGGKHVQCVTTADIKKNKKLKPIRVITIQTLVALKKKGLASKVLDDIDFLILDEVHHGGAKSYTSLLPLLKIYTIVSACLELI